jgi:hypothetical protein
VIKENYNPVYVAHPGVKRTYEFLSLNYWLPAMRKSIEEYIKKCDSCQKRKGDREFIAPLGEVDEPRAPFEVTSMDITGIYLLPTRKNRFSLTFMDHFTRYVEDFPIPDQPDCSRRRSLVTAQGQD